MREKLKKHRLLKKESKNIILVDNMSLSFLSSELPNITLFKCIENVDEIFLVKIIFVFQNAEEITADQDSNFKQQIVRTIYFYCSSL